MLDGIAMEQMSQMDIEAMDRSQMIDIQDVEINPALSDPERLMQFLDQVQNPYCFLCGTTPVKVHFNKDGRGLSDLLKTYFMSLKQ